MNDTIKLLMEHRSIRQYADTPLTSDQLHTIIAAGQQASTSSNMQAYSIIRITDKTIRQELMELSGQQQHVEEAPEFLVWCADLSRIHHATIGAKLIAPNDHLELAEHFIIAAVDAALAAQNSAVAAESMGLGILYVGGIRNHIHQVAELLQLPCYVAPLFGMCIGYPLEQPILRPRLPIAAVLHENHYTSNDAHVAQYNDTMAAYVFDRSGGRQQFNWSEAMAKRLEGKQRDDILTFLHKQNLLKK